MANTGTKRADDDRRTGAPGTGVAASHTETAGRSEGEEATRIEVRDCETHADYGGCVRLQRAVWGAGYRDVVTASLLKVSRRVGGVVAGAFEPSGEMVGFVFGLTGAEAGKLVHWSHMMAVLPAYRDRGVGRRLKAHQWRVLREMGVERAYWTFDPLVARNAHLNFNRLSVRFEEYAPDMYADTGSGLHAFGTDRLVVSWPVGNGGAPGARRSLADATRAPVVNVDETGRPVGPGRGDAGPRVRIAVPSDIEPMIAADLAGLRSWRASTRAAFERCLGAGYAVKGFVRGDEAGWYVLEKGNGAG